MSGRYIDADALITAMNTWDWQELYLPIHFKQLIDEQPTADVVEVVRCKDCMHTEIDKYAPAECQNRCKLSHQYHEPTFFCKCGEPRMDLLEWIHKGDADEQGV